MKPKSGKQCAPLRGRTLAGFKQRYGEFAVLLALVKDVAVGRGIEQKAALLLDAKLMGPPHNITVYQVLTWLTCKGQDKKQGIFEMIFGEGHLHTPTPLKKRTKQAAKVTFQGVPCMGGYILNCRHLLCSFPCTCVCMAGAGVFVFKHIWCVSLLTLQHGLNCHSSLLHMLTHTHHFLLQVGLEEP